MIPFSPQQLQKNKFLIQWDFSIKIQVFEDFSVIDGLFLFCFAERNGGDDDFFVERTRPFVYCSSLTVIYQVFFSST